MADLIAPLLKPLELALNKAVAQDPVTFDKLAEFSGHIIAVDIEDMNLIVNLVFTDTGLNLSSGLIDDTDLTITGKAFSLARLGKEPDHLFSNEIAIHGNVQFAKQLQDLLEGFEFDWEQQLARFTGDTLAYPIAHGLRQFKQWAAESHHSMKLNTSEYLKEEIKLLPDSSQVNRFLSDIDQVRADVERMEARVKRLLDSRS